MGTMVKTVSKDKAERKVILREREVAIRKQRDRKTKWVPKIVGKTPKVKGGYCRGKQKRGMAFGQARRAAQAQLNKKDTDGKAGKNAIGGRENGAEQDLSQAIKDVTQWTVTRVLSRGGYGVTVLKNTDEGTGAKNPLSRASPEGKTLTGPIWFEGC